MNALTRSAISGTALVHSVPRPPALQTFTTTLGGMVEVTIRGFMKDGEPWFVAKDVTDALGFKNGRQALATHVDDDQTNTVQIRDGIRGNPTKLLISEGGLYALIMGSKLPQAREFRRWVLDTVLPSIRKNGGYLKDQEKVATGEMTDAELMARALQVAQRVLADKDVVIARQAAEIADLREELDFLTVDEFRALSHCYWPHPARVRLGLRATYFCSRLGVTPEKQMRTINGHITSVNVYPREALERAARELELL